MLAFFWSDSRIYKHRAWKNEHIIELGDENRFANGHSPPDLREDSDATQHDLEDLRAQQNSASSEKPLSARFNS